MLESPDQYKKEETLMAQQAGMTDNQFNKHLADTLMLLTIARKEIEGEAPTLDQIIENLRGQITKP